MVPRKRKATELELLQASAPSSVSEISGTLPPPASCLALFPSPFSYPILSAAQNAADAYFSRVPYYTQPPVPSARASSSAPDFVVKINVQEMLIGAQHSLTLLGNSGYEDGVEEFDPRLSRALPSACHPSAAIPAFSLLSVLLEPLPPPDAPGAQALCGRYGPG
ncbi:hypothetical protein BT96DRAFT_1006844 [Gymnopus androsaceus JB14]|uniref:Uncharacterized protein n=1 Tax=Gymnopus androsaceus JB14 TaxID=1447944 RepID=A0A6A4GJW0_9AGAR|nr:hypothetical protein BT96DRAFT_1006844 [Gymnopus androsaceus JB14]